MRILQINVSYGHGSTGRIVETLHHEYQKMGHDSFVLFGRGKKASESNVYRTGFLWEAKLWRLIQMFSGGALTGSPLSTWNVKRRIRRIKPDVVHLHCINGNMCNVYSLMKWLRRQHYRTVFTHHGKFMFTGGCGINRCDQFQTGCKHCPHFKEEFGKFALHRTRTNLIRLSKLHMDESWIKHTYVSPWLMAEAHKSPLLQKADNRVVFNSLPNEYLNDRFDDSLVPQVLYVFFPSSMKGSTVKGAQWIAPIAQRLKPQGISVLTTESGDVSLLDNVIGTGHIDDPYKMKSLYKNAIATLVLSKFESFSMPTIESLSCGTPVMAFKAGGPETIETFGNATFVEYGDLKELVQEILRIAQGPRKDCSHLARSFYGPDKIAAAYLDTYKSFLP